MSTATITRTLAAALAALALAVPAWAQKSAQPRAKPKASNTAPTAKSAAPRAEAPGHLLHTIRQRGVLHVGIAPMVPWAMRDPAGEWQGYEVDVARQLASDLGVELTLVRVRLSQFSDALNDQTVDIVSGYSITPHRALVVDFSTPYAESPMQLVARADFATRSLDRPDVTLGVRAGGATEAAARSRFSQARIVTFRGERALYEALKEGKVDGALAYSPRAAFAVADSAGRLAMMTAALPHSVEGFAIRRGEPGFVNFLNAWVAYWKADGWLDERRRYWFDSLDWTASFQREAPAK